MKKSIVLILLLSVKLVFAGVSGTDSLLSNLKLSTYFETYYTYDFGNPVSEKLRGIVNHHKNNEIAINLALVRASYNTDKYRANLGVMIGTYANKNYLDANAAYKYIYESSLGIKLNSSHNIWFDLGIFPSHIGAESPLGIDNWTLTRSLQAEASPYYEAGARVSYTSKNGKLYASIIALNGWQVIAKESNYPLSLGTQIQYKPNSKIILNSSSYLGNNNEYYSEYLGGRYFHNFYTQIQWSEKFGTLIGFDIGTEESRFKNNAYYIWYSPLVIAKYNLDAKNAIAFRIEYLNDYYRNVFKPSGGGFVGSGISLNYDLILNKHAMFRIEGKMYKTKNAIFIYKDRYNTINNSITTAFIFHLND